MNLANNSWQFEPLLQYSKLSPFFRLSLILSTIASSLSITTTPNNFPLSKAASQIKEYLQKSYYLICRMFFSWPRIYKMALLYSISDFSPTMSSAKDGFAILATFTFWLLHTNVFLCAYQPLMAHMTACVFPLAFTLLWPMHLCFIANLLTFLTRSILNLKFFDWFFFVRRYTSFTLSAAWKIFLRLSFKNAWGKFWTNTTISCSTYLLYPPCFLQPL